MSKNNLRPDNPDLETSIEELKTILCGTKKKIIIVKGQYIKGGKTLS